MKRIFLVLIAVCIATASRSVVFASGEFEKAQVEPLSKQEEQIILDDLSIKKVDLSEEDRFAVLTKGTSVIWDKTYKNEYGIKKGLSMSASLIATGNRPYTTIKITNTGSNSVVVAAYKGSIGGSTSIRSMSVPAGNSKTMTISRNDVIKYGTINGQGTRSTLGYTVSVYNTNGKKISFKAYAKRYN